MAFWRKQTGGGGEGWTSCIMDGNRVVLARVAQRRDSRPAVLAFEQFAREGDDIDVLRRLQKGKHLQGHCTLLLAHGQYQLLLVDRPDNIGDDTPAQEMRDIMRWRIKEMVDFPVDQAGIDVLPQTPQGNRTPQMWVVAATHGVLRTRVELFQDAKADLGAIDIPEMAQRNLSHLFEEENRGLALAAFDETGGRLTITYQGELYLNRHLDVTSTDLTKPDAGMTHERVLLDIQRSLDNFDRNYSAIPVNRLLVAPLANGTAFIEYLQCTLSLPIAAADLSTVLDVEAVPALKEMAVQAAAWLALGAALRD